MKLGLYNLTVVLLMAGCANVKVHKVSVEDRIAGQDQQVKGFRYYLTRPYIVVGKAVIVKTDYEPVGLGRLPQPMTKAESPTGKEPPYVLVSEVPEPHTNLHRVFDLSGHLLTRLPLTEVQMLGSDKQITGNKGDAKALAGQIIQKVLAVALDCPLIKSDPDWMNEKSKKRTDLGKALDTDLSARSTALQNALKGGVEKEKQTAAENAVNAARGDVETFLTMPQRAQFKEKMDTMKADIVKGLITSSSSDAAKSEVPAGSFVAAPKTPGAAGADSPKPADTPKPASDVAAAIQVVFLPDFEEQYAIKNCNVLAKTKYAYKFRNGTELESISGSYNSTDLPVMLLETVGKLVTAAGEVAKTRIGALGGGAAKATYRTETTKADFYVKRRLVIEPGVYRVQKSWEQAAVAEGPTPDEACGLFADLGLPLAESVTIITGDDHDLEVKPPQTGGGN